MEPVAPATVVDRSEACENGESEEATGSEPVYSPYTSEESNQTVASISLPFIEVDMFEEPWPGEGDLIDDPAFRVMDHEAYVTDMASECQPLQHEHDVLPAGWRADGFRRVGILRNPSPCTRAKVPADRWRLLGDVPSRLRRPLTQTEVLEAYRKGQLSTGQTRPAVARPGLHEDDDRGRVHLTPRRRMFVPGIVPDEDHLQDGEPLPDAVPGLQGLRATQVGYQTPLGAKEYVRDNIHWKSWNASLDMNRSWRGITRFVTLDPATDYLVLATWMQGRQAVEELWRHGARANQAYKSVIKEVNVAELGQGMPLESEHHTQMMMTVLGYFAPFAAATALPLPAPPSAQGGLLELAELDSNVLQDVDKPETGKVRLELQWNQLSPAWQAAFEQPIIAALEIYFEHDALEHVMPEDPVHESEILPSRFVLVNKTDPKNTHPADEDLTDAKLKARLVIAGHRDQRAGDYATEAPTATLLAHNFICFVAAQYQWRMYFADIPAAFLQGDYLPEGRRVFLKSPTNYPLFVRQYLMSKVPPGARTDLFRMKKAGFGLAESPRLWYQRFRRDIIAIGGKELQLAPGVFSFFDTEVKLWATLAVHVDDVRFICSPVAEVELWPKLKGLFTFGDWVHPEEFTKFCGRWERQLPDGTVELQMNEYARKVKDPPSRSASRAMAPLMPNEKSWIGAIIGQLNWLARQARADLLYGCSRIQQLSGTNDPAALQELKVLVERAREPHTQVFKKLGCGMDQMRTVPGRISFDGGKSPGA